MDCFAAALPLATTRTVAGEFQKKAEARPVMALKKFPQGVEFAGAHREHERMVRAGFEARFQGSGGRAVDRRGRGRQRTRWISTIMLWWLDAKARWSGDFLGASDHGGSGTWLRLPEETTETGISYKKSHGATVTAGHNAGGSSKLPAILDCAAGVYA